jgi:hypothetical protein
VSAPVLRSPRDAVVEALLAEFSRRRDVKHHFDRRAIEEHEGPEALAGFDEMMRALADRAIEAWMLSWARPIGEAPRDGSAILTWTESLGFCVAHWSEHWPHQTIIKEGWKSHGSHYLIRPTVHWPLPAEPARGKHASC